MLINSIRYKFYPYLDCNHSCAASSYWVKYKESDKLYKMPVPEETLAEKTRKLKEENARLQREIERQKREEAAWKKRIEDAKRNRRQNS